MLLFVLLVLQLHTIDGRPVLSNHSASNGIVYLIKGFLNYEILTIGERIERTSYHSMFQEALTRVDLLDILTGGLLYIFVLIDMIMEVSLDNLTELRSKKVNRHIPSRIVVLRIIMLKSLLPQ